MRKLPGRWNVTADIYALRVAAQFISARLKAGTGKDQIET